MSKLKSSIRKRVTPELLILAIILLLAAFLRLYRVSDYMTFLGDEGRDVLVVKRILVDHKFTLLGPTASVGGFFLGPIYYYFMTPFLWLWRLDPTGPAVMVALFGVATVFLVYLVGKEFFGKTCGLLAATLYAVSPMVVAYSRSSWNPNLMPFFSLLTLYTLYKGIIKKSTWLLVSSGIFLGIAFQLHYLATFLAAIAVVYLLLMEGRTLRSLIRHYLLLMVGFVVGFSPFLVFELRHGFPNTKTIFRFILGSGETGFVGETVFAQMGGIIFRLFWRLLTRFPPLGQITLSENLTLQLWYWGVVFLIFASLGLFFFKGFKALKQRSSDLPKFSLLFLWLSLGIGLFSFYKKPIYDYYLGFMFPLPFLLVGNLLAKLISPRSALGLLIFILLLGNSLQGVPFRYRPNRQLAQTKEIAHFVLEKTEGKPFNFALVTGQNSDHAYRYFLEIWGAKPVAIENPQVDPQRKTVTEQLLIVCEDRSCQPLGHPLWEIAGFGRAEITGAWNVSVVKIYKLTHYKEVK